MRILEVVVPTPLNKTFDYLVPQEIQIANIKLGARVRVPFGRREIVGVIVGTRAKSNLPLNKLKTIHDIIDDEIFINTQLLQLYQRASAYYHYSLGEAMLSTLPKWLREGRALVTIDGKNFQARQNANENVAFQSAMNTSETRETLLSAPLLTLEQTIALESINQSTQFQSFLLMGVTGSGKTEVYLQAMEKVIAAGKQVLMLVPEIGLTPQAIARVRARFTVETVVIHSNLTAKERFLAWNATYQGLAQIIIGTRSALFAPFKQLGLIIVDEEHDASYKQHAGFRYQGRDLAVLRAQLESVPIILGSATPSLESLANVKRGRYELLRLSKRVGVATLPRVQLINLRDQSLVAGLSSPLIEKAKQHLSQGNQVLFFLNRRGFAPVLMCHHCGFVAQCSHCDVKLTLHHQPQRLICHHCEAQQPVLKICPSCRQSDLMPVGQGTERLEQTLSELFPSENILRIDRDTTRRKQSFTHYLQQISRGDARLLVGTQMLVKGHHFPNLTLVVIVDADSGLLSSDFRALERLAQTLVQVSGRAGRDERPGEVMIQTHFPEHPLLQTLLQQGYYVFAEQTLVEREHLNLPPYSFQAVLRAEAIRREVVEEFLQTVKNKFKQSLGFKIIGPLQLMIERKNGRYRWQLIFQAAQRELLHRGLNQVSKFVSESKLSKKVRWYIDVDPVD